MKFRIGIDVGGTFTDFLLIDETGHSQVYKTLTTPKDPTIGFFNGLKDMATDLKVSLGQFIRFSRINRTWYHSRDECSTDQ